MSTDERLTKAAASLLETRTSRRGALIRIAVGASALSVAPVRYLIQPRGAYATLLGTCTRGGQTCQDTSNCCDGTSCFCCTINGGNNTSCPSGAGKCGWWVCQTTGVRYVDCCRSCDEGCRCCGGACGNRPHCCWNTPYGNCSGTNHTKVYCRLTTRETTPDNCQPGGDPGPCTSPPACAQV